jgi:hypothetical protein
MNEFFFCIAPEHVETGEFLPDELGQWAVRFGSVVVVSCTRADIEPVWASVAHNYGYSHN